jgi:hypothetical protein
MLETVYLHAPGPRKGTFCLLGTMDFGISKFFQPGQLISFMLLLLGLAHMKF